MISAGIVAAGWLISEGLPNTTQVPSALSVTTQTEDETYGNYLSKYEIAEYLNITSEDVEELFQAGELEGTYIKAGANDVFSRAKIDEWVEKRIG